MYLQLDRCLARPGAVLTLAFWLALHLRTLYRWRKYQKLFWEHIIQGTVAPASENGLTKHEAADGPVSCL